MSYPDPYQAQQQPAPGPYPPPAPSGPYGYGYPPNVAPNGGHPPTQPSGAQPQPPYYPPPPVPPQPEAKRNNGNSRGWRIMDALLTLVSGSSERGGTARDRAKTQLIILGAAVVSFAILMLILVLIGK
jgi:hypothetical protein